MPRKSPPPSTQPPTEGDLQDIEKLCDALHQLRIILNDLVNGLEPIVSIDLREKMRAAWPEIKGAFDTTEREIQSRNSITALKLTETLATQIDRSQSSRYRSTTSPTILAVKNRSESNLNENLDCAISAESMVATGAG